MASCRFDFSAPPSLGVVRLINYVKQLRRNVSHCIPNRIISVLNQNNKTMNIMLRNIVGAPRSTWSSPTRRSINRGTTNFHRDLWLRELYDPPPSGKPLWFWILHRSHPAATADCMWGVVDGQTYLHRLSHTQRDIWSMGTRHLHQRAPWRRRSRCD